MVLQYRVSLPGIKGFNRVYHIDSKATLYDFHKQMRSDMEFPQDQLIMFKALGEDEQVIARYGLFSLGYGAVDEISMEKTIADGITHFIYFYDVTFRKSVVVTFEGKVDDAAPVSYPTIVEEKGPNPVEFENGYVAYEDLPEDQKHIHPGARAALAAILAGGSDDEDEDFDEDDEDDEDLEDEDDSDEDGKEIYDGSEF